MNTNRRLRGTKTPLPTRVVVIAAGYGTCAGAVAAITLLLMTGLQHWLWSFSDARWYVFAMVCTGGLILAILRGHADEADLDQQVASVESPAAFQWKKTALLAASAIVAVGFGGAIGPEAGLLAVVAELSALVRARIARTQAEERLVGRVGNAAVLSAVYGSPPAGASYEDDSLTPSKLPGFIAGVGGFLTFVLVTRLLGGEPHGLVLPVSPRGQVDGIVLAAPAALLACALAVGYTWAHGFLARSIRMFGAVWLQTLVGSVALAALLTAWPLLRFSGHAELPEVARHAAHSSWWMLAALAVLKALATAISLASSWRRCWAWGRSGWPLRGQVGITVRRHRTDALRA